MHKVLITCLLLFIGLYNQNLQAQEITLYGIHFPPHVIDSNIIPQLPLIDKNNTMYGIDVDLVREAYASQGVVVHFELMAWKRIMRNVEAGIVLGAITCRQVYPRTLFSIFSDHVTVSRHALVTRKYFLDQQEYSLQMLKKFKNVAVEGWSQTSVLKEADIPFSLVDNLKQGFNVILRRGQEVLVVERDNAIYMANKLGIQDQVSFYDLSVNENNYYPVCFSQDYPDAEKWRNILNKGLDVIESNGVKQKIFQRYGIFDDRVKPLHAVKE